MEQYIIENPTIMIWVVVALVSFWANEIADELEKNKKLEMDYWYDHIMGEFYSNKGFKGL